MGPITIRKHVDSETLVLPELRADEVATDDEDNVIPTLEEVRKATSRITGSMSAAIREERDERG